VTSKHKAFIKNVTKHELKVSGFKELLKTLITKSVHKVNSTLK